MIYRDLFRPTFPGDGNLEDTKSEIFQAKGAKIEEINSEDIKSTP